VLYYFAYGSNLLHQRLQARTPSAEPLLRARLAEHALRFHKIGDDGSGKCDAFHTGSPDDAVHGLVYALAERDKQILDGIEGVGHGYLVKAVTLMTKCGELTATTYVVQSDYIDPGMLPFDWYLDFVIAGARQNGLPEAYIAGLAAVPARPDADARRARANRLLLPPAVES